MKKPLLIELEGPEFSGKTTQANKLKSIYNLEYVRIPGYTYIGEEIRKLIKFDPNITSRTQLGLLIAAFYSVYEKLLDNDKHPSCVIDRGITSMYVYQGCIHKLLETNYKLFSDVIRDIINLLNIHFEYKRFYLKISSEEIIKRRQTSNRKVELTGKIDYYDNLPKEKFVDMVNYYDQSMIDPIFNNVKTYVIDGVQSLDNITSEIQKYIEL
jgi:thymidylate kinase